MFMVSAPGTTETWQTRQVMTTVHPGGITLFSDNFASAQQLTRLDGQLQHTSTVPLLISVDQEGGEVIRITSGVKQLPSEKYYGILNSTQRLKSDSSAEARGLRRLGINMNLAPVLGVITDASSPINAYQRSFGSDPQIVTRLGLAEIQGYQSNGVAATAKHLVGLGTTAVNNESTLPIISVGRMQLLQQLEPFRAAASAGVDAMMVTHVLLPGITRYGTPTSLSRRFVTGVLRQFLGYSGVVMTDSLTMGSIPSRLSTGQVARMAVGAGDDILLYATNGPIPRQTLWRAHWAIMSAVEHGKISRSYVDTAVNRILSLKRKLGLSVPSA